MIYENVCDAIGVFYTLIEAVLVIMGFSYPQVTGTLNEMTDTVVNNIARVNLENTATPKPSAIELRTPNAFL